MKAPIRFVILVACLATVGAGGAAYLTAGTRQGPILVDSPEALTDAIEAGEGTTLIKLRPGFYPNVVIKASKNPRQLILESADPAHRAVVGGIKIVKASDVTIRNLTIQRGEGSIASDYLVEIGNSREISLSSLAVLGPSEEERGRQYGAWIRGGGDVQISDCRFSGTRYGIGMLNTENVTLQFNEFRNLQTDGIRGGGVNNLTISGNVLGDFSPKAGEHPDGIQLWSTNQKVAARNITIRDNLVVRNRGGIIQGIFVRDTKNVLPFEDVTVIGNLVIGSMYNGISVSGILRGKIVDNQVYAYPDMKSWISLSGAKQTTVRGNKAMLFLSRDGSASINSSNTTIAQLRKGSLSPIAAWRAQRPSFSGKSMPYLDELSRP